MKRFSYFVFALLIIAVLGLFVIKLPNGDTVLSIDDLNYSVKRVKIMIPESIDLPSVNFTEEESVNVYMWVDEQGITHYSDVPVEGAKQAELPQATILPAEKVQWPESQVVQGKAQQENGSAKGYFEQMKDLKSDAEQAKKQLEMRTKQQQEVLNNL